MKNKLKVTIHNRDYTLISDETKEYTDKLAMAVDTKIKMLLRKSPSLSVTDAAVICALDAADELAKANANIENIRSQIKDYVEEAGRARIQVDEAHKQIALQREKIAQLEADLKARTTITKNAEEKPVSAEDILSAEIAEAINTPVHTQQETEKPAEKPAEKTAAPRPQNRGGNFVGTVNYDPHYNGGQK